MSLSCGIHHGDCFELLPQIRAATVDLVLTDPPYNITGCKWDVSIDLDKMWAILKRIGAPHCVYVFTANQPFTTALINSNPDWFKYEWIWDKYIARGLQVARHRPMPRHETVLVFCQQKTPYYPQMEKRDRIASSKNYSSAMSTSGVAKNTGHTYTYTHRNPTTIISGLWEPNAGKLHPCQKPVSLFAYLINTYTRPDDLVVDPFVGSGTTAIAALRTGRDCIAIEKDAEFYKKAASRLASEKQHHQSGLLTGHD